MPSQNILVLNAGSSSLKYELFALENQQKLISLTKGIIDLLPQQDVMQQCYEMALQQAFTDLKSQGVLQDFSSIKAIGHRVVHGGEKYTQAIVITPEVEKDIEALCVLAPLHNPANLACIRACAQLVPKVAQVAVFDTAFHQTLPEHAYLYALPYNLYEKYKVRRYGFHGTSHKYVSQETIKLLCTEQSRIVVCHLGNGSSVTAVKNGQSIDTSMGFTPLEGLPMGTRCGDIDPALVFWLMENLQLNFKQIEDLLEKESGLLGLSGVSSDMRQLHAVDQTDANAQRAINILAYKTAKYIASYTVPLGGLDALTFTAGIGEKAFYLRAKICEQLEPLGIILDREKNEKNEILISAPQSKIKVYVIPTDEQKQIAEETVMKLV